jgi:hypothetical protein
VNGSIYHSSTYAAKTDEEWAELRFESIKQFSDDAKEVLNKANSFVD